MKTPLLERFVGEARELLQGAATALLTLEKNPGDDAGINEVFRSVHTLKGSAGLFDFPAFSRLVHAGEDVLSAIRAGEVVLTGELVDLLLDSLDLVNGWVDRIDADGIMPDGADGTSRELTGALRAVLPARAAEGSNADSPPAVTLTRADWLHAIAEHHRQAAFAAVADGAVVLAVEYVPAEDCFFSGEDPFGLFRELPGLLALEIDGVEPFPLLDSLDPYHCVLRFRVLTTAPRHDIEHLFRYVIEQIQLAPVTAEALVSIQGDQRGGLADAPAHEAFAAAAPALAAAGDWPALSRSAESLRRSISPALVTAAALRWLTVVLAMPTPNPRWVTALLRAVTHGEPGDLPLTGTANAVGGGQRLVLSEMAARILDSQRTVLDLGRGSGDRAGWLASVGRTVGNVLAASGGAVEIAEWVATLGQAADMVSPDPLIVLLDGWLAHVSAAQLHASPLRPTEQPATRTATGARAESGEHLEARPANRVLKVDQARIDTLMNLIGELVVSKNSLPFLARRAEHTHGSREMSREIKDVYSVIDRLAQEMQHAIMAVRMLPVSEVFDRFPRLVRDVARRLGKRIELVIHGEDTVADKNIIEVLGDPLLHIIRNSIDHGIEPPDEREATGKPPLATVMVKAFQESDQVVIEVTDDGRGIDPEKIKAVAVEKGIIDADRAARMSDQDAVNLVFRAGFSTAANISDLSGRGVGMDVVVTTVEKAGGSVKISSRKGDGTAVRLSLPLTMAVTRVMMVEAGGGMLFGIPMDQIAETVRVPRNSIRKIKLSDAFVLRDTIVPIMRLDRVLGLEAPIWIGDGSEEDAVLVVRVGESLAGLVVDHFREGMDVVLKPFAGVLTSVAGYAGTALLGDGRVLLVLNLKELL
jgi:two-component system, chemotaxis family, sensor kinase CheA